MNSGPGTALAAILDLARNQSKQRDLALLLALAIGFFAATPFLTRASLPHATDAELHIYRAAELGHAVREGVFYPRWAPNLYLGYGYPIFNYYAPMTYYLANLFDALLPGTGIVAGVKGVFVLGLLISALGAYLLGRDLFGPAGGILSAASFTFSPYVLFIDPHARGDLAEHFAVCLLPLAFHYLHKLMESPTRCRLLGSVLSVAALVFSHNLIGLVAAVLLLAYWMWQLMKPTAWERVRWGLLAFALAAALIAFFWFPALLERDAIKLQVTGPGHFDFREHFLSLGELLAPPGLLDWGASGPRFHFSLGWAQWILALGGLASLISEAHQHQQNPKRRRLAFFVATGIALVFLMLSPSQLIWERIPVMPYLQFPWRLLGPANMMLAISAASAVSLLPQKNWRRFAVAGALALVLMTNLPLLYPPPWSAEFGGTSPADIIHWEKQSQALGTTSTGDFLPVTVDTAPPAMQTLIASYAGPGPVDKVNRATVPKDTDVLILEHGPNYDRFHVSACDSFRLRLYTFYFPGWRAYVDGERVPIELGRPEGFITLEVPRGEHTVSVRFEGTAPRRLGWVISAGGLVVLIALMTTWQVDQISGDPTPKTTLPLQTWLLLAGTLALIVALKAAVIDPRGCLYNDSPPGYAIPAEHKLRSRFENGIELIGYDLPRKQVHAGETFSVVLYWHAVDKIQENYQSFVHMTRPSDVVWAQEDHLNPGGLPTTRWSPDNYVWDEYNIQVGSDTPPGEYDLSIGLYLRSEGYRAKRRNSQGDVLGDSLVIDSIRVPSQR